MMEQENREGVPADASDLDLLRLLNHRSAQVRQAALEALLKRDAVIARIAARATLGDTNPGVRNTAAEALAEVGTRLDIHRLTLTLEKDKDWVVRASAADSLGAAGRKIALPALVRAMRSDPHPIVRRDAAFALAYAQETAVLPDLENALAEETEEQARVGLLKAVYVLGQTERLTELLALLCSKDSSVRAAVVNSISEITRPEDHKHVVETLRTLMRNEENPGVRGDTEQAIADIAGRPAPASACG